MGNNISKASDAALARVTFYLSKADIRHSYKDYLAIELLNEDGSMALHALSVKISRKELKELAQQISNMISMQPKFETLSPEAFMQQYRAFLLGKIAETKRLSTLNILLDIIADNATHTSQIMANYGITERIIGELLQD